MALAPEIAPSGDAAVGKGNGAHVDAPELRLFVMGLFFIFGGITSLNDVIIPKLKELFTLNYTQAMLVQFCFFTAYLLIGIPGAKLVKKVGTADITVTLADNDEYVAAQVSTMRAAKARAEAQATRIEGMIQNLLALPAPTEQEAV